MYLPCHYVVNKTKNFASWKFFYYRNKEQICCPEIPKMFLVVPSDFINWQLLCRYPCFLFQKLWNDQKCPSPKINVIENRALLKWVIIWGSLWGNYPTFEFFDIEWRKLKSVRRTNWATFLQDQFFITFYCPSFKIWPESCFDIKSSGNTASWLLFSLEFHYLFYIL